jgi:phosphoglycolate phosphatase-like HAD superfamily hydrolase
MCVGVATGPYPSEALIEAGADYVFENLSDPETLLQFL